MRFMMLMIPKGYEQAAPGTMPPGVAADLPAIQATARLATGSCARPGDATEGAAKVTDFAAKF